MWGMGKNKCCASINKNQNWQKNLVPFPKDSAAEIYYSNHLNIRKNVLNFLGWLLN